MKLLAPGVVAIVAMLGIYPASSASASSVEDVRAGRSWHVKETTSPLNDAKQIMAIRRDPSTNTFLSISCTEGVRVVVFGVDKYIGGGAANVVYRVDKQAASAAVEWEVMDGRSVVSDTHGLSIIDQLTDGSNLFVRISGKRSGFVDANFTVGEITPIKKKIDQYCPKSLPSNSK